MSRIVNIVLPVCLLIPLGSAVSLNVTPESPKASETRHVAVTEAQIAMYCFTNNEIWRHTQCTGIIDSLEAQSAEDFVEARMLLAKAYEGLKTYATNLAEQAQREKQELEVIESLLERGVRTAEVLYLYARALPPKESVPVFEELLAKEPEHVNGLTLLAFNLQQLGGIENNKEAAELLKDAYDADSGSMKYFSAMKAYEALHAADLGSEAVKFRQHVSADLGIDAAVDKVRSRMSKNGDAGSMHEALEGLADKACIRAYLALEDPNPCLVAVQELQALHDRRPNDAGILRTLIDAASSLSVSGFGNKKVLQGYYEQYMQLEPNDVETRFEYAQLLPSAEQFELLKRIVAENRKVPAYVHFALAKHLEYSGNGDEAVAELTKAFNLAEPVDKYSYGHDLLRLLENQNKHQEAENVREQMREIG